VYGFTNLTEGNDTITNFKPSEDHIEGSASGFGGGLTAGSAITPEQFRLGTAAADASNRFIYNSSTGALFFDRDGTGTAVQEQFATLTSAPTLSNNDIFIL